MDRSGCLDGALAATYCHDGLAQSGPKVVKLGEERIAFQAGDPDWIRE